MSLRIGGVPENVNAPIYLASENAWADRGISFEEFPSGTGAMTRALADDRIDIAVALTEGLVNAIAQGSDFSLLGMYTESPLIWGVHVPAASTWSEESLNGARFAISRYGSGSHLMAMVEARRRGWRDLNFVVVNDLPGAREALESGQADVFLWEKFTTKPLVDSHEWDRIGEWVTPWPAFAIAIRNDVFLQRREDVDLWFKQLQESVAEFAELPNRVDWIADRFGLQPSDVLVWLRGTTWRAEMGVSQSMLTGVLDVLKDAGLVEHQVKPEHLTIPNGLLP